MKLILALLVVTLSFTLTPSSQADSPIPMLSKAGPAELVCKQGDFSRMNCHMDFAVKSLAFVKEQYGYGAHSLYVYGTRGEKLRLRGKEITDGLRTLEGCRELALAVMDVPGKRFSISVVYKPDVWETVKDDVDGGASPYIQLYGAAYSPFTLRCEVHKAGS